MKPGEEIIDKGIVDLRAGVPVPAKTFDDPEHRLYRLLAAENQDSAHSRYNALFRLLVSFERAAETGLYRDHALDPRSFARSVEAVVDPTKNDF